MMKKLFKTKLFGYKKNQVDKYIQELKNDYENELCKKKDRMVELNEENRKLKQDNLELNEQINRYLEQEKYVSRALVKAEQRAQSIIEDGHHQLDEEKYKLKLEKEKWKEKVKQIRSEIINFDRTLLDVMDKFHSDLNYYTGKEISEELLVDEEREENKNIKKVIA